MSVQVLVATMHQPKGDYSLLEKMNIQSDAIICNQCDRTEFEFFDWEGYHIQWLSFDERGVGLNRNNALMRADGDIIIFADDDVRYEDGYPEKINSYYVNHPKSDVVIFNFLVKRGNEAFEELVCNDEKINRKKALKYPTYCVSCKNAEIKRKNIYFHREFGGGACFSHGEDTIFLQDCVKARLHMHSTKEIIGVVDHGVSTWFTGFDAKFFYDKGVLFSVVMGWLAPFAAVYHCFKHRRIYNEYGWVKGFLKMYEGIIEFQSK